jgi:uncharacterized membrane protein HdeD (DUF308 family)
MYKYLVIAILFLAVGCTQGQVDTAQKIQATGKAVVDSPVVKTIAAVIPGAEPVRSLLSELLGWGLAAGTTAGGGAVYYKSRKRRAEKKKLLAKLPPAEREAYLRDKYGSKYDPVKAAQV